MTRKKNERPLGSDAVEEEQHLRAVKAGFNEIVARELSTPGGPTLTVYDDPPPAADPRLTVPLARPVVALDKIIRVSFVHQDDRQPTFAVQQEIPWLKASKMRKGVKPGKIRLQVNGPGEHREIIFDDAVELLVFVEMADRFLQALVK